MTKNNPHIKNLYSISFEDKANIINIIVSACFQEDENNNIEYTPYFRDLGTIIAISKYLIEGITFDKDEDIYNSVMNDADVSLLVDEIINSNAFDNILCDLREVIDFKKQEIIAKSNNLNNTIAMDILKLINRHYEKVEQESETLDNLNCWITEQRELNSLITPEMQKQFAETLNVDSLISAVIEKYGESELFHKNREIIEASEKLREKESKIIDLQNELHSKCGK